MKASERGVLTLWRRQNERLCLTPKDVDRARGTHQLGTTEGGTCQDKGKKRLIERH